MHTCTHARIHTKAIGFQEVGRPRWHPALSRSTLVPLPTGAKWQLVIPSISGPPAFHRAGVTVTEAATPDFSVSNGRWRLGLRAHQPVHPPSIGRWVLEERSQLNLVAHAANPGTSETEAGDCHTF